MYFKVETGERTGVLLLAGRVDRLYAKLNQILPATERCSSWTLLSGGGWKTGFSQTKIRWSCYECSPNDAGEGLHLPNY